MNSSLQDYNETVMLNLYVTPVKPVVSYLEPLTGYELPGLTVQCPTHARLHQMPRCITEF